jgi:hypothetical protein
MINIVRCSIPFNRLVHITIFNWNIIIRYNNIQILKRQGAVNPRLTMSTTQGTDVNDDSSIIADIDSTFDFMTYNDLFQYVKENDDDNDVNKNIILLGYVIKFRRV